MSGGSSASPPPDSTSSGVGGASKLLANLPSRGLFSATVHSTNLGKMRDYVCDHETSPPENQVIKTNQMNILIRSLTIRNHDGKSAAGQGSRKRAAERGLEGKAVGKRAMTSTQLEGSSRVLDKDLQCLTVEKLRALLKERGLSLKGKKDELIARLRGANG